MADFALLHGGGQGGWAWEATIAALALQSGGEARCVALDVAGCGAKRGRDTSETSFEDIAAEAVADIERARLSEVVLVGHSQAGLVLPRVAELAPALVRRLVYVSCVAPLPGKTVLEQIGNGLRGENPEEVGWPIDPAATSLEERYRAMFCNDMDDAEARAFVARLGADRWPASSYTSRDWRYDHLAEVPATYVHCLRDMSLPPVWQERFAERLKVQRQVRIDAGHQAMNTRPHALAEILLAEAAA